MSEQARAAPGAAEHIGGFLGAYWPVIVGTVTAAVAWGTLYTQVSMMVAEVRELSTVVHRVDVSVATTEAHVQASAVRTADMMDRLRALEQRR